MSDLVSYTCKIVPNFLTITLKFAHIIQQRATKYSLRCVSPAALKVLCRLIIFKILADNIGKVKERLGLYIEKLINGQT